MKIYGSIGHFKGSENITFVCMRVTSRQNFLDNLGGNGFVSYMVVSESMLDRLKIYDDDELWNQVKKSVGKNNYRRWDDVREYINQCYDIMLDKWSGC